MHVAANHGERRDGGGSAGGSSGRARDMLPDKADKDAFSADAALPLLATPRW